MAEALDTDGIAKPWTCKRCGATLALVLHGEPDPQVPPARLVTVLDDDMVFICRCGCVQVWHRVARAPRM